MGATAVDRRDRRDRIGRIGPNAITRVAEVLPRWLGAPGTQALLEAAGLARHLHAPPEHMVDEDEVRALHAALRARLGAPLAREVARAAGRATADYLLAHRIPRPLQALLARLPARWAARVLLAAITRHAWTFAGSGRFAARVLDAARPDHTGRPSRSAMLEIRANPLCRGVAAEAPACDYYAATFERLFRALVHAEAVVVETECEACGGAACRFDIRW